MATTASPRPVRGRSSAPQVAAGALFYALDARVRRRRRRLKVHGEAPATLTEDGDGYLKLMATAAIEAVQSFFWAFGCAIPRRMTRIQFLATRYNDFSGAVFKVFVDLKISGDERLRWLDVWASLDKDASNSVDFQEFTEFFEFPKTLYSKRLFDTFDADKTASVPIRDFLATTWATCAVTRAACEVAAFRLLRRDAYFDEKTSTVDVRGRAETKLHGAFKVQFLCAQRRAGVFLNISAKFRGRPDRVVGYRTGERRGALHRVPLQVQEVELQKKGVSSLRAYRF